MDYTTVTLVKQALGATETTDDALLARLVTASSRAIDRHCGSSNDDYFKLETVTDEPISGLVDKDGKLICWPHKPKVTAVTALNYRYSPVESWKEADVTDHVSFTGLVVTAWLHLQVRSKVMVKLSYTGGLAATVEALPADFVEAATVLAVRFYKEVKSGLADTIGVAELGTLQYTKKLPVRVIEMLRPYTRKVPW